ncbi:MAG TPA: hypothetical protein DD400_01975 [Rhodospirillaceae bacterium]|nr:hypothetical protein [Rhodospirillaceae bacterium]
MFKVGRSALYDWLKAKSLQPKPAKLLNRKIDKEALATHVRMHPDALLKERANKKTLPKNFEQGL